MPSKKWPLAAVAALALTAAALVRPLGAQPEETGAPIALPGEPGRLEPDVAQLLEEVAGDAGADPDRAQTHARLAMVYEANNLWPEARDSYAQALAREPDNELWRLHLAIATREAGDVGGALELLRAVVRSAPALAAARQRLGEALLETGDLDGARRQFEYLTLLEPRAPQGPAGLAHVLLRQRRFGEAATLLERVLERAPSYRVAHYLLGLAYRGLGRLEDAERELKVGAGGQVLYLPDPLSAEITTYAVHLTARLETARAHLGAGRAPEAVAVLEAALASHPRNVTVMNNLAIAYMRTGRLDRARELLLAARELDDGRFSTWLNLASCAQRQGRLDEALVFADGAVERAPNMAQAHLARANVLGAQGDLDQALGSLRAAARLGPDDPRTRLMIGDASLRLGRLEEAAAAFRAAAELDPRAFPAHLGLAAALIELDDLEAATKALAEARALAPDHPRLIELERRLEARRRP